MKMKRVKLLSQINKKNQYKCIPRFPNYTRIHLYIYEYMLKQIHKMEKKDATIAEEFQLKDIVNTNK